MLTVNSQLSIHKGSVLIHHFVISVNTLTATAAMYMCLQDATTNHVTPALCENIEQNFHASTGDTLTYVDLYL
jgi:hypothetical protein